MIIVAANETTNGVRASEGGAELTTGERAVLDLLKARNGAPVTGEEIMEAGGWSMRSAQVRAGGVILRLRRKGIPIENIRMIGWRITE